MRISFGAIAQLGERLHGMQEVSGSIPLSSTKIPESVASATDLILKVLDVPIV